jgi:hypothetical protein
MISCRLYSFKLGWKSSRLVHSSGKNCCDKLLQVVHQLTNFGMWGWFSNAETTDAFEWEASGYWESNCNRGCPQRQPISTQSSFIWRHAKNVYSGLVIEGPLFLCSHWWLSKRALNLQDVLPVRCQNIYWLFSLFTDQFCLPEHAGSNSCITWNYVIENSALHRR